MIERIAGQFVSVPVFNQLVPDEGPKSLSVNADFNGIDEYDVELLNLRDLGRLAAIQTVYFDNSLQNVKVQIEDSTTGQRVTLPGLSQGYLPILINKDMQFKLKCSGGSAFCKFVFLNVPMAPYIWSADNT